MKQLILILLAFCIAAFGLVADTKIKKTPLKPTSAASGEEMYKNYCASCHGIAGKGNGPAARALKAVPTDLTVLAKKNGGKFPENSVYHAIVGDPNLPTAHGSTDMPVWGSLFMTTTGDAGNVKLRIANLTKYIEGMQVK